MGSASARPSKIRQLFGIAGNPLHQLRYIDQLPFAVVPDRKHSCQALDFGNSWKSTEFVGQPRQALEVLPFEDVVRLHGDDVDIVVSEVLFRLLVDGNPGVIPLDQRFTRRVDIDRELSRFEVHECGDGRTTHPQENRQHQPRVVDDSAREKCRKGDPRQEKKRRAQPKGDRIDHGTSSTGTKSGAGVRRAVWIRCKNHDSWPRFSESPAVIPAGDPKKTMARPARLERANPQLRKLMLYPTELWAPVNAGRRSLAPARH